MPVGSVYRGSGICKSDNHRPHQIVKSRHTLLRISIASAVITTAQAATIQNLNLTLSSNPPIADIYFYNNPAGNSWTVNGNITVGDGTTTPTIDSRLFVGLNNAGGNHGLLTLTSTVAGSSLLLDGWHSADPVLGRLGHVSGGNWTGILNIDGGLAVTMGGRKMKYEAGANTINVMNGILNYTTSGFGWLESAGTAFVNHVIGADGSLVVPGIITDAAGFAAWGVSSGSGVELNDITVAAASGLTLDFANDGVKTTITAVPEPGAGVSFSLVAGVTCFLRRRR